MWKKLAIVAACIAVFPQPASADRAQPPAATPGPIIVDGRARVDSRMPDQMTPAQRAAYRRIFTLIRGNQFAAAAAEFYNSLEAPALHKYPLLALFQQFFGENGAVVSLMSGSGVATG